MEHIGKVVQILGPILDIRFQPNEVPTILNAVRVEAEDREVWVEVSQDRYR